MPVSLSSSFTFLIYPFTIPEKRIMEETRKTSGSSIWQKSQVGIKEHFLFKHVESYFNYNADLTGNNTDQFDTSQAIIFELKDALKATRANCSFEKLFTLPLVLSDRSGDYGFQFSDGLKKNILSPKLFLIPQAGVGCLTLCLTSTEREFLLPALIDFNYACRNLKSANKNSTPTIRPQSSEPTEQIAQIFSVISQNAVPPERPGFSFIQLVHFLLQEYQNEGITALSHARFHIFSYIKTAQQLTPPQLNEALFRLSRVYNQHYFPPFTKIEDNPEAIQTFRDIYMAVSQEGGCLLINSNESEIVPFLETFGDNVLKTRYIWIYLLAFLQRITLVNTSHIVSEVLKKNNYDVDTVSRTIQQLSKIQIRSMFSQVSNFTMHNDFYALCRNNFKVPELFNELKQELFDLNMILQQEVEQSRLKRQHTEREKEKAEEIIRRRLEENQVKFGNQLNLALLGIGLLTFLSVWKDFSELYENGFNQDETQSLILLLVAVFLFGLFAYYVSGRKNVPK